jgi:hypothetical protein
MLPPLSYSQWLWIDDVVLCQSWPPLSITINYLNLADRKFFIDNGYVRVIIHYDEPVAPGRFRITHQITLKALAIWFLTKDNPPTLPKDSE